MTPDLRDDLLSIGDARLRRVVAVVDALPARGEADLLIAPLRPRLARLRPARPITLTRVLFVPVEPLIVAAELWHPGSPAIARSALGVLGSDLRAALGEEAQELQARFTGRTMADAASVAECGAQLWPRAAALLPGRGLPAGWAVTGLPDAAHAALVTPLSTLLAEGSALHRLPGLSGQAALSEGERLLRRAAEAGTPALAMMLALLLRRLPRAQRLLQLADGLAAGAGGGGASVASERALGFVLGDLRAAVAPDAALPHAAEQVRRSARMLEELQAAADATQLPGRLVQVREARRYLAAQCRERLVAAAEHLAAPGPGPAEPGDLAVMEEAARALRRLDAVGRHLGDADAYDRALSGAAGRLVADPRLPAATRLRLAEILLGPDAALALMAG
jgi:hypothetical protein